MNLSGKQSFKGHLAIKVIRDPKNMTRWEKLVAAIKARFSKGKTDK